MQEALQNPHFKKIWEKINWQQRHPEAKTLYSALLLEGEEYCSYGVVMRRASRNYGRLMMFRDMYSIDKCNTTQRPEIIGRLINLEDIIQLEINPQSFPTWDEEHIKQGRLVYIDNTIMLGLPSKSTYINLDDSAWGNCFCADWQLTKPLHEQTPETWEKIANLI